MKLSIHEASKLIGVAVSTMRRWESEGLIIPERTEGGHRRYDRDSLLNYKYHKKNVKLTMGTVECHLLTKIEIINYSEDKNHEEELVEDVLSVITVFSARLYGSRSHKTKKITETNKKLFKEELLEEAK